MLPALALRLRVRVLLALLAAAAVCLLATPAVRKFACKIGAMDKPGESRRIHDHPIPRLGGLALFAGFLAGVLPFTGIDEPVQGILLGSVIIVVTGAVDDLVSLRPWVKLVLQIAAAVVAIRHGVVIRILTNPGDASAERSDEHGDLRRLREKERHGEHRGAPDAAHARGESIEPVDEI